MADITEITNHVQLALARLPAQFQSSPNFQALITLLANRIQTLEGVLFDVKNSRTVTGAVNYGQQGPSGTGTGIVDGTVVWKYLGVPTGGWQAKTSMAAGTVISVPQAAAPGNFNVWYATAGLTTAATMPANFSSTTPALTQGSWALCPDWQPDSGYAFFALLGGTPLEYAYANGAAYKITMAGTTGSPNPALSFVNESLENLGALVGEARGGRNDAVYQLWIQIRELLNRSNGTGDDVLTPYTLAMGSGNTVALREMFPAGFEVYMSGTLPASLSPGDGLLIAKQAKAAGVGVQFVYDDAPLSEMLVCDEILSNGSLGGTVTTVFDFAGFFHEFHAGMLAGVEG